MACASLFELLQRLTISVAPADSRALTRPPIGALPRKRLASSATGSASALSTQPLTWYDGRTTYSYILERCGSEKRSRGSATFNHGFVGSSCRIKEVKEPSVPCGASLVTFFRCLKESDPSETGQGGNLVGGTAQIQYLFHQGRKSCLRAVGKRRPLRKAANHLLRITQSALAQALQPVGVQSAPGPMPTMAVTDLVGLISRLSLR